MRQVNIRLAVEGHRLGLKGGLTVMWESEMSQALCLPVASILSPVMQVDIHRNGSTVRGQRLNVVHLSPDLVENEVNALISANNCNVPRVVKYEELIVLPNGDGLVVLE